MPKKKGTKQVAPKAKKPPAKKATTEQVDPLLKAAREVLPRLKVGATTLSAERDRLQLKSNAPLRKALTEVVGGKREYGQMMKASLAARSTPQ